MKNDPLLDAALSRLADKIESGHFQAAADPVGFVDAVIHHIAELEAAAQKLVAFPYQSPAHACDGRVLEGWIMIPLGDKYIVACQEMEAALAPKGESDEPEARKQ